MPRAPVSTCSSLGNLSVRSGYRDAMTRPPADRWLQVGIAIFLAGASLAVPWFIHATQQGATLWRWPGIAGTAVAAFGVLLMVLGLVLRDDADVSATRDEPHPGQDRGLSISEVHGSIVQVGRDNKGTMKNSRGRRR
jgi:hypothetical protein